ncbi:hypothetical protein IQ07DRAFT_607763 [Pyrenochaeta sp. DS3sAY3a]|nr:hypothetical protein IQ07DRAFT_607763 [Pyrenochaeta sp. DS3sAY3a]
MSTHGPQSPPLLQLPIPVLDTELLASVNAFVFEYMSKYDNSHDYQHILRVVSNSNRILQNEIIANPSATYNTTILFLAALLHDVGDHKYIKPGEDVENQIANILKQRGAEEELAFTVQNIVKNVGYTNEIKNSESVAQALQKYPELAIVQDADRLDAIGAVGVARCFSFGAAKFPGQPMSRAIDHFEEKLYKLADMMKTKTGKEMAQRRNKVLQDFAKEWEEETKLSFALQ